MRTPCPLLAQLELSLIGGLSAGYGAGCDAFLVDIMGWTSACPLSFLMITSRTLFLIDIILIFFCLISGPRLLRARPTGEHERKNLPS